MVKDTAASTPPTGAEIDAGVTSGGKKCDGNTYQIGIDGEAGSGSTDTNYWKKKIHDVKNNWKIWGRVRTQNTSGQKGPWSSESPGAWVSFVTTKANNASDTTAPALPTSVTVTAEQTTLKIKIATTTADRDLAGYQISIKEGASEGASVSFSSDHAANVKTSIAVTADNATATYNYTGKAGFNYIVAVNAYDKSGNVNSGWTEASAQVLLEGLTSAGLSDPIAMAIYTGAFTADDPDTVTWENNKKVKIKRTGGTTKEYTITGDASTRTTGNLAGTRYIVFNKATSTSILSVVTTPGDDDIVIAKVSPVTSGKANILRFVGNEEGEYSISRFSGGFNQLSAITAELGKILMSSGGYVKIYLDSAQSVIRIAKDGYNADTETDPDKLLWSSEFNNFKILEAGSHHLTTTDMPVTTVNAGKTVIQSINLSTIANPKASGLIAFIKTGAWIYQLSGSQIVRVDDADDNAHHWEEWDIAFAGVSGGYVRFFRTLVNTDTTNWDSYQWDIYVYWYLLAQTLGN